MQKKQYTTPEVHVIKMQTEGMCTGSGNVKVGVDNSNDRAEPTAPQLSNELDENSSSFWNE